MKTGYKECGHQWCGEGSLCTRCKQQLILDHGRKQAWLLSLVALLIAISAAISLAACGTVMVPPPPDAGADAIEDTEDASTEDELVDAMVDDDADLSTEPDADGSQMVVDISESTTDGFQLTYYGATDELALSCSPDWVGSTPLFSVPGFSIPPGTRIERVTFTCRASEGGRCSLSLYDENGSLIDNAEENNLDNTWGTPLTLTMEDLRTPLTGNFHMRGFMECGLGTTMMGKVILHLSPV